MPKRARAASLLAVLVVAIGLTYVVPRLRLTTEITAFLPDDDQAGHARLTALLAQSQAARVMILSLALRAPGADPAVELGRAATSLLTALRQNPDIASARSATTEADADAALAFLSSLPPTTFLPVEAYADAELAARLTELGERLADPTGVVVRQRAPFDPLGNAWAPLAALAAARGDALVEDGGILRTADGAWAILFVETVASPFDSAAQRRVRAALWEWQRAHAVPVRLETAGAAQFSLASEQSIKADIGRIGTLSTIGLLLVFLVLFGSLRLIALGVVPMLLGSAVAVLGCWAIWGQVHGITIAFGTSLLGVGLDYVEHYYAHFALAPKVPAATTMRKVAPSLVLGALTTVIGFVGLAASGLGGLRQMAVFSVIAIVSSIAATCLIVPAWMPGTYRAPRSIDALARAVAAALAALGRWRLSAAARVGVVAVAAATAAYAAAATTFSDDVRMLVRDDGPHVAEDRRVRERLGPQAGAFAVVSAPTDDELLAAVGRACAELALARTAGAVASYVELDQLAPSAAVQRARFAAAKDAAPRLRSAMDELGMVTEGFAPYFAALEAPAPRLLSLAELRGSPLAPLVAAWFPPASPPVALIPLVGADPPRLRAQVPSAVIVVPAQTVAQLFHSVRARTVIASGLGFAAIFLLLFARYRSARKAALALVPASLACVATVAVLAASGVALNILHVMALLLVVSLSVDFGIFLVDTTGVLEESSRTMVSILTASTTTVLSFGLLGLSASPGLAALGATVTSGVAFSLLFCFLMSASAAGAAGQRPPRELAP